MNCTNCKKTNSQDLTLVFKHNGKKIRLDAYSCRECGSMFAEDRALLRAARKHMRLLASDDKPNS